MKQHITQEQLNGLSRRGKRRLLKWSAESGYYSLVNQSRGEVWPLLDIGQMIELLDEHHHGLCLDLDVQGGKVAGNAYLHSVTLSTAKPTEFCDALWEAVKEVLEK